MLQIIIPAREYFDDSKQEFVTLKEQVLNLEHSLISISKWESKWEKPFLDKKGLTNEEFIDYVQCMTINSNVDPNAYKCLTQQNVNAITKYMDAKMTATWFNEANLQNKNRGGNRGQVVTSELIYYWMISYEIPFECQKWHLNRLLTLIHVCEVKNSPSKKMSRKDIYASNRALNEARRKAMGSKG